MSLFQPLSFPRAYIAFQRAVGADRLRYLCMDRLALKPGDRVLDIGCGPGYYLDRLPAGVRYDGYDTSGRYIAYARRRHWGSGIAFHHRSYHADASSGRGQFTAVILMGILHHLPDEECRELLGQVSEALTDGGCVVSVDTCFSPGQGIVSRWMSENDRGSFVRTSESLLSLAGDVFLDVSGDVLDGVTRIPGSYLTMCMRP
ncbi:methyltransferase domain-containing protein [Streptomyces sp. NBC_00289]|uniref:class I SAM-dependent methyltransferase n=1 Tax=Streptomyces sp. NBC_00289 TaxID=2975703 RepID=UPI00352C3D43